MKEKKVDLEVLHKELIQAKKMSDIKSERAKNHWALLKIYYGP